MKRLFFVPRGRSSSERLARGLLLAGVFALAVAAYQKNFERVIARTEARGVVADPAGLLTREDRLRLLEAAEHLAYCDHCMDRYTALLTAEALEPPPKGLQGAVMGTMSFDLDIGISSEKRKCEESSLSVAG